MQVDDLWSVVIAAGGVPSSLWAWPVMAVYPEATRSSNVSLYAFSGPGLAVHGPFELHREESLVLHVGDSEGSENNRGGMDVTTVCGLLQLRAPPAELRSGACTFALLHQADFVIVGAGDLFFNCFGSP